MSYQSFDLKAMREEANPPKPKKDTRFKPGQSGNPAGRTKGTLNKATLVKQAVQAEAEGILLKNAAKVIEVVVQQAKDGCRASQKLIWDSLIAKRGHQEEEKEHGPPVIKINIERLETTNHKSDPPVDAEYELIEE